MRLPRQAPAVVSLCLYVFVCVCVPVGLGLVWNVTKAPWENVGVVLINVLCLDRDLGSTVCIFVKTQGMYS